MYILLDLVVGSHFSIHCLHIHTQFLRLCYTPLLPLSAALKPGPSIKVKARCAGRNRKGLWSPRVFRDIHQEIPIPPSLAPLQSCKRIKRVPTHSNSKPTVVCLSSIHIRSSFFLLFYSESCLFTFPRALWSANTNPNPARPEPTPLFPTRASMLDRTSYNLSLDGHRAMQIQRQRQSLFTNDRRQYALARLWSERFHFDVCFDSKERYLHVFFLWWSVIWRVDRQTDKVREVKPSLPAIPERRGRARMRIPWHSRLESERAMNGIARCWVRLGGCVLGGMAWLFV